MRIGDIYMHNKFPKQSNMTPILFPSHLKGVQKLKEKKVFIFFK